MKLKKLKLNKQTIANLSSFEMNHLKGGANSYGVITCVESYNNYDCITDTCPKPTEYTGHTAPPRCCKYGCCETIGC